MCCVYDMPHMHLLQTHAQLNVNQYQYMFHGWSALFLQEQIGIRCQAFHFALESRFVHTFGVDV